MTAADLLRQAIEDAAPTMHVETDPSDGKLVLIDDDREVLLHQRDIPGDGAPVLRLLRLLLAAAPHLADLLDAMRINLPGHYARLAAAIEEAAR